MWRVCGPQFEEFITAAALRWICFSADRRKARQNDKTNIPDRALSPAFVLPPPESKKSNWTTAELWPDRVNRSTKEWESKEEYKIMIIIYFFWQCLLLLRFSLKIYWKKKEEQKQSAAELNQRWRMSQEDLKNIYIYEKIYTVSWTQWNSR